MIRKKPWNRVNLPVYSVSSYDGKRHNMNICTYVTAISMQPKLFIVGFYEGTKTFDNICQDPLFLLQLLAKPQIGLVRKFGKQSGKKVDKLAKMANETGLFFERVYLKKALAIVALKIINKEKSGDHWMALCEVVHYKNLNEGDPLTLDDLREKKLIRI